MKKVIVILICAIYISYSQIPDYLVPGMPFESKSLMVGAKIRNELQDLQLGSALVKWNYDLLNYDIYLDWYNIMASQYTTGSYRNFSGSNSVKLVITDSVANDLQFDAENLLIDSVKLKDQSFKLNFVQDAKTFTISLLDTKFHGDTVNIVIFYTYIGQDQAGLYLYPKGLYVGQGPPPKYDSIFVPEKLAYTMSEPKDARKWVPCNDSPFDKAMVSMKVKLPKYYNASSNGLLVDTKIIDDSVYYSFVSQHPMSTYLMVMNASKFRKEYAQYKKITDTNEVIPIEYDVWDKDWTSDTTNGGAYNAQYSFQKVPEMIKVYANYFGEYPYEKYGMTAVQPFSFGGMEHQTMTTINRVWLRGYYETGIAHELSHQWLGDLITCATWLDIWINEGGASWCEALWEESQFGKDAYYAYMNNLAKSYFQEQSFLFGMPIYGEPSQSIFIYPISLLEYNKAAWIYHMLREQLGEDQFKLALHNLIETYKYKSLESIDFMNSFKQSLPNSNIDFNIFFNQWIASAGHPQIAMTSNVQDWGLGRSKVTINISQIQNTDNVPLIFVSPVELQFFKNGVIADTATFLMKERNQQVEYELGFSPDSVVINRNKLLCEIISNITSVKELHSSITDNLISPNPVHKGEIAKFKITNNNNDIIKINVYNVLGEFVNNIFTGNLNSNGASYEISIPTSKLNAGNYYILIDKGTEQKSYHLVVIE